MIFSKREKQFSAKTAEYTISDLLAPETLDRLYDQVTNPKASRKSAGSFSLPDFKLKIPLESKYGKSRVQCLCIRPKIGRSRVLWESLIWTTLFGSKRLTMIHWYILYSLFEKTLKKDKRSLAMLKILRITTERSGSTWNQKLKPVKTIVQNVLTKDEAVRYCLNLASDLGIKSLPDKDPHLNEMLEVRLGTMQQKRPEPLRRVGVGYKDKGSLPKGPKEDAECSEDYLLQVGDLFADLMSETDEVCLFLTQYDPKKHEKLLSQVKKNLK
jgi:hypothetical protein